MGRCDARALRLLSCRNACTAGMCKHLASESYSSYVSNVHDVRMMNPLSYSLNGLSLSQMTKALCDVGLILSKPTGEKLITIV